MKNIALIISVILILSSCKKTDDEVTILNNTIDRLWKDNLRTVSYINSEVENQGNRRLDIEVLDRVKTVLKLRREYNIPEHYSSIDDLFQKSITLEYISAIKRIIEKDKIDIENSNLTNTINLLSSESIDKSRLQKRIILISLIMLEADFLEQHARMVSGCNLGAGIELNFDGLPKKLFAGQYHESITSIVLNQNNGVTCKFINLSVAYNDEPVEFEFKSFDNALFLTFFAANKGKYKFSFDLETNYMGSEINFKQHFETEIIALENPNLQ